MAYRIDKSALRPAKRLADGRLRADAVITRTGVFVYRNADGSQRREYRPPEEVFNADSLESFAQVPVTNEHPTVAVNSKNARKFAVGSVGENVRQDGDNVIATVVVYDAATISQIDAGKSQLSCGYTADIEATPGVTPEGEHYDCIQRNIRGNHLAVVSQGRAGNARLYLDDSTALSIDYQENNTMDEKLVETLGANAVLSARCDALQTKVAELEKALAAADNAAAEAKARADAAEKARNDSEQGFTDRVKARVALEAATLSVVGRVDSEASDRDLKLAVIKHVDKSDIAADRSDDYVTARFDSCVERAAKGANANAALRSDVVNAQSTDPGSRMEAANAKMFNQLSGNK